MSAPPVSITVRLFAMLRERAGTGSLELQLAPGSTVKDALTRLAEEHSLGDLLARLPVRTAVNRDYAASETVLATGDELALIPPVSGGAPEAASGNIRALVTAEPLSHDRVRRAVADPSAGAVVLFEGVTREIEALDYEAYEEMAQEHIAAVLRTCAARHGLCAAAAEHRTGRVALGEPSVLVAVSAPHREEAFAAAREAIDTIKAHAPIWKRERRADGGGDWVPAPAPPALGGDVRGQAAEGGARSDRA